MSRSNRTYVSGGCVIEDAAYGVVECDSMGEGLGTALIELDWFWIVK